MELKKILAVVLSMSMAFGSISVNATEVGSATGESVVQDSEQTELNKTKNVPWDYQGKTTVKYFDNTYLADVTVTIPKLIELAEDKTATYDVSVKGEVEPTLGVSVEPHDDIPEVDGKNFYMRAEGENDVVATANQADTIWISDEITPEGTVKQGTVEAKDLTRGDWLGTLNFDINMSEEYGRVGTGYGVYSLSGEQLATWEDVEAAGYDISTQNDKSWDTLAGEEEYSLVVPDSVTTVGTKAFYNTTNMKSISLPKSVTSLEAESLALNPEVSSGTDSLETVSISSTTSVGQRFMANRKANIQGLNNVGSVESYALDGYTGTLPSELKLDGATSVGDCVLGTNSVDTVYLGEGCWDISENAFVKGTVADGIGTELSANKVYHYNESLGTTGQFEFAGQAHECTYGDPVVVKEATCTEAGSQTLTCTECGKVKTEEIPAKGHTFENKFCSVCGIPDESAFSEPGLYSYTTGELRTPWLDLVEKTGFDVTTDKADNSIDGTAVNPYSEEYVLVLPDGPTRVGMYKFTGCTKLKSIVLSSTIKELANYAFGSNSSSSGNKVVTSVIMKNVESIGDYAFRYCPNLSDVVGLENVKSIGAFAFANTKATEGKIIKLPNLESIANGAVVDAEEVYVGNKLKTPHETAFSGCQQVYYYPKSVDTNYTRLRPFGAYRASFKDWLGAVEKHTCDFVDGECSICGDIESNSSDGVFMSDGKQIVSWKTLELEYGVNTSDVPTLAGEEQMSLARALNKSRDFKGKKDLKVIIGDDATYTSISENNIANIPSISELVVSSRIGSVDALGIAYLNNLKVLTFKGKADFNLVSELPELVTLNLPSNWEMYIDANKSPKLKEINIEKAKDGESVNFYSIDGVMYENYLGIRNVLIKYPSGKDGSSFEIPDDVGEIRECAFANNKNLKVITVPSSVTRIPGKYKTDSVFYCCSEDLTVRLKHSEIPFSGQYWNFVSGDVYAKVEVGVQ